ncbi:ATP-binding protein [Roseofilum casamattae]|uniref:ATP-binding protein n=1 Tax=Roseofilum casamattae BLCC-M143 TaxID=3022442 RepID=A0ABT7BVU5_9CYAN|nr:ATP-binding protein [Roseofilum casamattae]MDJ1183314.1 ATP-binding protein [Roseofilum casamattae BLCC-M143]
MNAITLLSATPREFHAHLQKALTHFQPRPQLLAAIDRFYTRHPRGYFTLIGPPGTGKTALLARYATTHPRVIYYSAQLPGKNQAETFLLALCRQLSQLAQTQGIPVPETASSESPQFPSSRFAYLLQTLSDHLPLRENLVIAIDGCDNIDRCQQPPGTNLFYLPRYLPNRVYILLARRPFPPSQSGLFSESPQQSLHLLDYPDSTRETVCAYVDTYFATHAPQLQNSRLSDELVNASENNFTFLSQILPAITQNYSSNSFHRQPPPPGLAAYYQQHLTQMNLTASPLKPTLLQHLAAATDALSVEDMAAALDEDEYDIETILEEWTPFLIAEESATEPKYRLYHRHFAEFINY